MTIIIHPGLKKCGSSSIHVFLAANRRALRALKIDYPLRRPGTALAHEMLGRKRYAKGTLSTLSKYWAEAEEDTLILSSELLEEVESKQAKLIRHAFLKRRKGENFIIVFIIRDLVDMLPSMYAQKIKTGQSDSDFDTFFNEKMEERRVNYFATIARWADAFGWESLRIRVLDKRHLVNGDLLEDFLSILNVSRDDAQSFQFTMPGVSNAAPGWRIVELLRAIFNGTHGLSDDHPLMAAVLRLGRLRGMTDTAFGLAIRNEWGKEKGRYMTLQQAQQCVELHSQAVSELNRHVSYPVPAPTDLVSRGFMERLFLPDVSHIPLEERRMFYDDLWAALNEAGEITKCRPKRRPLTGL